MAEALLATLWDNMHDTPTLLPSKMFTRYDNMLLRRFVVCNEWTITL
jgi:hypothetical protein